MRVRCRLPEIRGDRKIRQIEAESGVSRGTLSYIERGRMFPADEQIAPLERAYGQPITVWYDAATLLELQKDAEAA